MATRWMKWDEATHIFMYSTDGVTFAPLPLNAACITEGTLNPSVIPGGSGPSLSAPNIWTGLQTYSGVAPSLRFQETDASANNKVWDIGADGALFNIKTLTDAFASPTTLFSLDRLGQLKLTPPGSAVHELASSTDNPNLLKLTNLAPGGSAYTGLLFRTDQPDGRFYIVATSSANLNAAFNSDALNLLSAGVNGINLNSTAGPINFRSGGGTSRLSIATSGAITISSTVNAVNGYLERNRTTPVGELINIPFNASDFTTVGGSGGAWTVTAGNVGVYGYSISGRQVTVVFDFVNTTFAGSGVAQLNIKLPAAITPVVVTRGMPGWAQNPAGFITTIFTSSAGVIQVFKDATFGQAWVAGTGNVRVAGTVIYYI